MSEEDDESDILDSQITYRDSNFELVLPSGARIGHRSMRCYYEQSVPTSCAANDPKSATAIVWWLLADKWSDLVPVKGGFGASRTGMQTIKGCNCGEVRCQNSVLKGKNTFQEVWKECRQVSGFGVVSSEK